MCPTKQLMNQQVEPQPKPQAQVQVNHEDGTNMGKKKKITRRGGRRRHHNQDHDAIIVSKNQKLKNDNAHIKDFKCEDIGHFASKCPNKLEKKDQATQERQGNEKHHMSKEEKTQFKRQCYLYRERRHMAYSCPFGNNSKSISIDANIMLRKDGMVPHLLLLQKLPLFILRHCQSMLLLT